MHSLFESVIIPEAVHQEILALSTFEFDLTSYQQSSWISIRNPVDDTIERRLQSTLDKGESAAIALAHEMTGTYLAIDEKSGRRVAKSLGIPVVGLIGILIRAKREGHISAIKPLIDRLIDEAGFYLSKHFYKQILQDQGEFS